MPVLPFLIFTLCFFAIAYRYYSAFLASKVLYLNPQAQTPAYALNDGQNYFPTNKWVLFGHHFAAISGAGPLIGPVLAAQFGFLPGFLWLVIGVVLGGAVHDFVLLTASLRHNGQSIVTIAEKQISRFSSFITSIAILLIIIIALAGLGIAVVNALSESAWGTFSIAMSVPLALGIGVYTYFLHNGASSAIVRSSIVGVGLLLFFVFIGKFVAQSSFGYLFLLSKNQILLSIAVYGFIASVLPVWLLLCPRDYLSSYLKLGTILFLIIAVFLVRPDLKMPALTPFVFGGGPILSGKVFPFVFITIACGAISGFHGLVSTGTTPKMIKNEMDARMIGYGAMLLESLIGVVALIAAASLHPEDYFAINTTFEKFQSLKLNTVHLNEFSLEIGEALAHRPGGAVSLAVGMAQIFSGLPLMKKLLSYWYHFAIMFEALFILTTIDTGTRIGRFLVQDFLAKLPGPFQKFQKKDWLPGNLIATAMVVGGWSFFIYSGSISNIWPLFGLANQLLASISLCIGLLFIQEVLKSKKHSKKIYLIILVPLFFLTLITSSAGLLTLFSDSAPTLHKIVIVLMLSCLWIVFSESMHTFYTRIKISHQKNITVARP